MGRRWLGPKHAYRVSKNPLHYTSKIELTRACIRCERVLHLSAFLLHSGIEVGVCTECRGELNGR